jgi:uncharacterized membrane protein
VNASPVRLPWRPDARLQILIAACAIGLVAGALVLRTSSPEYAPLTGWDVAVAIYLLRIWLLVRRSDADRTGQIAAAEDPTRVASDALLLAAAVASLATVGIVLSSGHASGTGKALAAFAAVMSVVLSWLLVHVVHTLAYARRYYADKGGVDFGGDKSPAFSDFAYLAFTIGMTFQVSDTPLTTAAMRRVALRHALLSYLFGTVIVATAINLIVGLG